MPTVRLTDCQCYYELTSATRAGDGVVLLISGLGATCRTWDPIAPDLAARRWVLAADNRGMGRSAAIRTPEVINDYAADLVELLDHLQIDRADVVGLSLGGVIAQRLAADHPQRVRRLVLMSTAGRFSPYLRQNLHLLSLTLRRFSRVQFARTLELMSAAPPSVDADPDRIERKARENMARGASRRAIATQLRCVAASRPPDADRPVRASTLVLSGRYDGIIPDCYGRQLADGLPDARFELLPEAGHNPLVECPQRVCELIEEFLDEGAPLKAPGEPARAGAS